MMDLLTKSLMLSEPVWAMGLTIAVVFQSMITFHDAVQFITFDIKGKGDGRVDPFAARCFSICRGGTALTFLLAAAELLTHTADMWWVNHWHTMSAALVAIPTFYLVGFVMYLNEILVGCLLLATFSPYDGWTPNFQFNERMKVRRWIKQHRHDQFEKRKQTKIAKQKQDDEEGE